MCWKIGKNIIYINTFYIEYYKLQVCILFGNILIRTVGGYNAEDHLKKCRESFLLIVIHLNELGQVEKIISQSKLEILNHFKSYKVI